MADSLVYCILTIIYIVQMIQYCTITLYLGRMPGHMYVNGIVFGIGELSAIVLSGWLMQKMIDITAFRFSWALGVLGYGSLICFPDSTWIPYLGILLSIWSIGGWINTQVLILEMRVHP